MPGNGWHHPVRPAMGHLVQYGAIGRGRQVLLLVEEEDPLQLAVRVKRRRLIKHTQAYARHIVSDVGIFTCGHVRGDIVVVHHHSDEVEGIAELVVDLSGQILQGTLPLEGVDGGRIPECKGFRAQLQRGQLVLPWLDDDGGLGGRRHHAQPGRRAGDAPQAGADECHPLAQAARLPPAARGIADERDGRRIGGPEDGVVVRHLLVAAIGEAGHGLILHLVSHHHRGSRRRYLQVGHHGG
ncbi:hypothetical protein D3C78_643420 [compost metagenome]